MGRLLCTDLDRTIIPNGVHPVSPHAHNYLERCLRTEQVTLAYVTGRHRALVELAISEFHLPTPHYVIADVGSTIYQVESGRWNRWNCWRKYLAEEWEGINLKFLVKVLLNVPEVCLQEPEKQSEFKHSFYIPLYVDPVEINSRAAFCSLQLGIHCNLIWSVDEQKSIRLLDVLPSRANKLHAIRYLMQQRGFSLSDTIFAGDSGNDLDVLESDIPAILVANACDAVKVRANKHKNDSLYIAQGGYLGMNGNYCAGILEGVVHYWPDFVRSLGHLTKIETK